MTKHIMGARNSFMSNKMRFTHYFGQYQIAQCKQEADYEPANILLERIKIEKK
jgi:hypothetical protein